MEVCDIKTIEAPDNPNRVRACAQVVYDDDHPNEELWFELDQAYADQLSDSGNPWLACMLPLAACLGQPLKISRPVDPLLLQNARELLRIWDCWYDYAQVVDIDAVVEEPTGKNPNRNAAFFSGGIDAFFTVLNAEHPGPAEPLYPIDDLISVWGFDIPIDRAAAFQKMLNALKESAADLNKNLIDVATNLRTTRFRQADWSHIAHGGGLASVGLLLERRLKHVLIASGSGYRNLHSWGSHPLTDPLYSTANTRIIHHGSTYSRTQKTITVAQSDIALQHIHVCHKQSNEKNCCECTKCYRTMITLDLLGVLGRTPTFPQNQIDTHVIKNIYVSESWDILYMQDIILHANKANRPEVAWAAEHCLKHSEKIKSRLSCLERITTCIFKLSGRGQFPRPIRTAIWWINYRLQKWILRGTIS